MALAHPLSAARDQTISIRIASSQRDIIDRAAHVLGTSRSDFMLDAAYRRAEDVLLDQAFFSLDAEAFERFEALLDAPPPPAEALRHLLHRTDPWE
jgi:uncharacterized protein (DUF1778 family)